MILLNPPAVRNCEPPVGLSRLAGALEEAGEPVTLIDGAHEGPEHLWGHASPDESDSKRNRAVRSRKRILENLQSPRGYSSFDRYKKNLSDLIVLLNASLPPESRLTPADYRHALLSPLRSRDIQKAGEQPEENPFYPWFTRRLPPLFEDGENRLGLSVNYQSQVLTAAALIGYVRRSFPAVEIVLGGGLISSWARRPGLSRLPFKADLLVPGRGEEAIVRFCGREYKGPGTPRFGNLYDNRYIAPGAILPYSAADSCSWKRCTFCAERWENYPYCEKPAKQAARELRLLTEAHRPRLIHLTDSEISPSLMKELIQSPPGAPWYGFSRFTGDMVRPDFCRELARSGCGMLCLGLESGDQAVLNSLKKGIRLDMVSAILKNLKEAGIGTFVYLLFGTPAEDEAAAFRTRDFILSHREYVDFLNLAVFTMPLISGETEDVVTDHFYEGDLSLSTDFRHPAGWGRREVRRFLDREFRGVPELRNIIRKTPPVFTSNHAPFFLPYSN